MEYYQTVPFQIEIVIRIVVSALCGALIGYERKRRQKEAGIRTHLMVALGSAVFAIVSKYGCMDVVIFDGISADASRVAANIVTGVSFLGAGMIFVRSKAITGLTTAAGIWAVSAIGLSYGFGMYVLGASATVVIAIIQYLLHKPLHKLEGPSTKEITVVIRNGEENMDDFIAFCRGLDPKMFFAAIERRDDGSVMVKVDLRANKGLIFEDEWKFMHTKPYVKSISF